MSVHEHYHQSEQLHRYMKYRIHRILLVCSSYDGYILEEDGTSSRKSTASTST